MAQHGWALLVWSVCTEVVSFLAGPGSLATTPGLQFRPSIDRRRSLSGCGQRVFNWWAMPTLRLKSIFGHPEPVPPPVMDLPEDGDLPVDDVKRRLSELPRQRQQLAQDHAAKVEPLLKERRRLEQDLGSIDAQLAWEGIQRQDAERELDREGARLQALLVVRPVEGRADARVHADDAVEDEDDLPVDPQQVERVLNRLLSGKLARSAHIASTPEDEAAQLEYDRRCEAISAWARQQVQIRHATGHVAQRPAEAKGMNDKIVREIAARQGLAI